MVHILLKPGLENFEHYFSSMWDECNCAVVWAFFGIAFLWDWNENWPFPVLWPLLSFPTFLAYWVQHFHSIIFQDLKQHRKPSDTPSIHTDVLVLIPVVSLVAQTVKNLPAMRKTWVLSLGWEDPQEEAWQPILVFLPVESPWTEELVGYSPWGHKELDMTDQLSTEPLWNTPAVPLWVKSYISIQLGSSPS